MLVRGATGGVSVLRDGIRIGVAGAGVFGGFHAAKVAAHKNTSLGGVFDVDMDQASHLSRQHVCAPFNNYQTFLASIDAVIIAAPASAHYDLAREALSSGVHALVEKPIALNVDEADALLALARKHALTLQIGHQERYVLDAAGLFTQDRSPLRIDCVRTTAASGRCEDVSVVLDLMIHDIDLVRRLTGATLETVTAKGNVHEAAAELMLSNGALVAMKASRRASSPDRRMTMVFDDGVIEFDFNKRTLINSTPASFSTSFPDETAPLAITDPLAYGTAAFVDAIATGQTPMVSGEDGREALVWARRIETAAGIHIENVSERRRA